jgi:hypothetical protein
MRAFSWWLPIVSGFCLAFPRRNAFQEEQSSSLALISGNMFGVKHIDICNIAAPFPWHKCFLYSKEVRKQNVAFEHLN